MADNALDLDPSAILAEGENPVEETEIDETPAEEPVEGEAPSEEPAEGGEEPAEGDKPEDKEDAEPKGSKGDDDVDLRKASKEIRDALTKFRDADPANKPLAKALRTALGHDLAFQESFKTPQEAREFKAAVEAIGGREALADMSSQIAFSQETDSMLQANDPKVLDRITQDFPEALPKLLPHVLDRAMKANKEAYASAIQPHLIDNLEAAGVGNVLSALKEAAEKGDNEAVQKIAANLAAWYGGQKSSAMKFRTELTNPMSDELTKRSQELDKREASQFESQWKQPVGQHASNAIYKAGAPFVTKVPVGQQRAFFQAVISEVDRRITGDKTYTSQEQALMRSKNRDANKIVAFKNAKIDTIVPDAVAKVAKDFGYKVGSAPAVKPTGDKGTKPGAKAPAVTGAGSTPQNPVYVKEKPADADRDKTIKGYVDHVISGRALMKSGPYKGKWVSWRPKPSVN
jgi:hypothetical protein